MEIMRRTYGGVPAGLGSILLDLGHTWHVPGSANPPGRLRAGSAPPADILRLLNTQVYRTAWIASKEQLASLRCT